MDIQYKRLVGPEYIPEVLGITSGKTYRIKDPSKEIWEKLVRSAHGVPHSPLRVVIYRFYLEDIPYWVSVHLVRHHIGVQFYVQSQRKNKERGLCNQNELVNIILDINANALLTLARARLCNNAAAETRTVVSNMKEVLSNGDQYDQILSKNMQPSCKIYKQCFEPKSCYE